MLTRMLQRLASKCRVADQMVEGFSEGEVHQPPPQLNHEQLGDAGDDAENPDDLKFSLHPDDPGNFLKLCSALRILVRRVICDADINEADQLIREYNTELIKVRHHLINVDMLLIAVQLYGSAAMKPNHHFSTHVADCVRNFGPLHDFWTFLFERLNKVLKSFKTNNHGDGELETTFFREFQRTCQTSRLVNFLYMFFALLTTHFGRLFRSSAIQKSHSHVKLPRLCSRHQARSVGQLLDLQLCLKP